ncbi:MAG: LuxR C-terminal-related transcriptional regulator [Chromatiaceae bacterium]
MTRRDRDVLNLIISGKANKVIAWDLGTSVRTIETHRANLMRKLQVRAVADLVRLTLPLRDQLSRPPTRLDTGMAVGNAKILPKDVGVARHTCRA